MTACLWHQAQAQVNPVTTVLGNGAGYAYFILPATAPNPLAGGTGVGVIPVIPAAPVGAAVVGAPALNFGVSKTSNVQRSTVVHLHAPKAYRGDVCKSEHMFKYF
jgi:hypothetical protein